MPERSRAIRVIGVEWI